MATITDATEEKEVSTPQEANVAEGLRAYLRTYNPKTPANTRDLLDDRFRIITSSPLPEFNSDTAQAFAAKDEKDPAREVYAMVLSNQLPYRLKAIQALKDVRNAHMTPLLAYGVVELSAPAEMRMVLFFEKPAGRKLSDWLKEIGKPLPDRFIMEEIIRPLNDALKTLGDLNITHGRINLDNIYYDKKLTLGECLSQPCGYTQPWLFEPLERIQAQPLGKGEGNVSTDGFATGVVAMHLALGKVSFPQLQLESYLPYVAERGSYMTLAQGREFSDQLNDFLRGTLNDSAFERWTHLQIAAWLGGKRFNLIPPVPLRESSRSFEFNGKEYSNRRMLAYSMLQHWEEAGPVLREEKIIRWIEISAHKSEVAEIMERIVRSTGGDTAKNPRQNNELVARSLLVLDPTGPIRYLLLRSHVDGLGPILAEALRTQNKRDIQMVADSIDLDLTGTWSELNQNHYSQDIAGILFKMQRVRTTMKSNMLGGGIERALYDLNPSLPCQSPRLIKFHILTLDEMMHRLDALVKDQPEVDIIDRHTAAFICSRMDIAKEMKIQELSHIFSLSNQPKLSLLKMLAMAQEKSRVKQLPGLTHWMGLQTLPLIQLLHRRAERSILLRWIEQAAGGGSLPALVQAWAQEQIFREDQEGFADAGQQYRTIQERIDWLMDDKFVRARAQTIGDNLSLSIAYLVFIGSLYFLIEKWM